MKEVEPVRELNKVQEIEKLLIKNHGQVLGDAWRFGCQVALRISDLLSIKMADVKAVGNKLQVSLKEAKTGKTRIIELNGIAANIYRNRLEARNDDVYLFQSHGVNVKAVKPLSRQYVARAFKDVGHSVGVRLSTHSMRKTRGYHLYKQSGHDIGLVQALLNHRSSAETLRYIGVNSASVSNSYDLAI